MKKFLTWLSILTKRQLKNPFLIAIMILIPIICLSSGIISSSGKGQSYTAGIYLDGSDEISKELSENLLRRKSTFTFVMYDDLDSLYRDVRNNTLISGYIFPDDLKERTIDKDCTDSITAIYPAASSVQGAVNEVVYSELIKIQGRFIISDYVDSKKVFNNADTDYIDELLGYYSDYLKSDVTFHIVFNTYGIEGPRELDRNVRVTFPVRGILAILVYLAGMFGSVIWMRDNEKGIFVTLSGSYRILCRFLYAVIPTVLCGIMMTASLYFSGNFTSVTYELPSMLLLIMLSSLFGVFMTFITKTSRIFAACIPVILLCALIFCPVFFNAGNYVPAARFVEKLFAPYYYLEIFA